MARRALRRLHRRIVLSAGCLLTANALAAEPAFQHIIIDPHPSVNGFDTLEKALVDINGDGLLDAVLGEGGGGLYWHAAPASDNLADPWIRHTIAPDGNFYEDIAVADVNGDGVPAVMTALSGTDARAALLSIWRRRSR
jgi:hypothetical protein